MNEKEKQSIQAIINTLERYLPVTRAEDVSAKTGIFQALIDLRDGKYATKEEQHGD